MSKSRSIGDFLTGLRGRGERQGSIFSRRATNLWVPKDTQQEKPEPEKKGKQLKQNRSTRRGWVVRVRPHGRKPQGYRIRGMRRRASTEFTQGPKLARKQRRRAATKRKKVQAKAARRAGRAIR